MLLGKTFDAFGPEDIAALVAEAVPESVTLDFKAATYGNTDKDKREFAKDLCAFANTRGGYLILGVAEREGVASAITPLRVADVDVELQRLEQIARSSLDPPLVGQKLKRVQVDGGDVIVVWVPRSYDPPHRVISGGVNRYYGRSSAGGYELSVQELRMLFGQRQSMEEGARAFVAERFARIKANEGSHPLPVEQGGMVVHLVPMQDLGEGRRIETGTLREVCSLMIPIGSRSYSDRINLGGIYTYRSGTPCHGYTQVFRFGGLEATSCSVIRSDETNRRFGSETLAKNLVTSLPNYFQTLCDLNVGMPIMLQISFWGTMGLEMGVSLERFFEPPPKCFGNEILLPPSLVEDPQSKDQIRLATLEQMNFLWNAFGFEKCHYFDADGNWTG